MNSINNGQAKIAQIYPLVLDPNERESQQSQAEPTDQLLSTLLGFDMETCQVALDCLLPSKKVVNGTMSTRKYKQVVSSISEIGLIEPL